MRALAVIGLTLALLAAPAVAQACERSAEGERYQVQRSVYTRAGDREAHVRRYAIALCDTRIASRTVLRRGALGEERSSGLRLHAGWAAGGRVVWVEERRRRADRTTVTLVEARARDGAVLRRTSLYVGRRTFAVGLGAVVTPDLTIATLVPSGENRERLVLLRGGERKGEVARGFLGSLAVEDRWTLRWVDDGDDDQRRDYLDLRAPARSATGCPARRRFERLLLTDTVEVSRAQYGGETSSEVVRACLRSAGTDAVVAQARDYDGEGTFLGSTILDGDKIAVLRYFYDRYSGCGPTEAFVRDLRTGAVAPVRVASSCAGPRKGEPAAITDSGVLGWVAVDNDSTVLRAITSAGATDLDRGAITNLRADGSTLRWENAGEPRSAEVEPVP